MCSRERAALAKTTSAETPRRCHSVHAVRGQTRGGRVVSFKVKENSVRFPARNRLLKHPPAMKIAQNREMTRGVCAVCIFCRNLISGQGPSFVNGGSTQRSRDGRDGGRGPSVKPYLQNPTEVTLRGIPCEAVLSGAIRGVQVDVVVSGIGAVYAASATSAALLQTTPDCILSVGCSGAHQPGQGVGGVVLGSEVVPLDLVVVERAGASRLSGVRCSMTEKATMSWACDPSLTQVALEAAARPRPGAEDRGGPDRLSDAVAPEPRLRSRSRRRTARCARRWRAPHRRAGVPHLRHPVHRDQGHRKLGARADGSPARPKLPIVPSRCESASTPQRSPSRFIRP